MDASVWSRVFRRDADQRAPEVVAVRGALDGGEAIIITGIIPRELLQGFTVPQPRKELLQ